MYGWPYTEIEGAWCLDATAFVGCVSNQTPCDPIEGPVCDLAINDDTVADWFVELNCLPAGVSPCEPPAEDAPLCE